MEKYITPTFYIDSDHPKIIEFAKANCKETDTNLQKAVQLNLAVRDGIRYNPYSIEPAKESMKASCVLKRGDGYCVAKAVLLAACIRSRNIPARLGFADVQNHLNTRRLKKLMGTDTFIYHGYTEIYLNEKWVKATPAFNLELCNNFNVKPLDFDGINDSVFHPFDKFGNKHMEYVKDHGTFADLPWDRIISESRELYPAYFEDLKRRSKDFSNEALCENS
ncbi:MAG: transglutaminase family protein [Desulfobacula sp.]|nr:transglutaminase family protein [Desulfobacula sp.]